MTSARHFDTWWKKARAEAPDLLTFTLADLVDPAADEVSPGDYPGTWDELPLSYEFAPGEPDDGVTVDVPLAALGQVNAEELGWQVPGRREELVTELIRSLPKDLRAAVRARTRHRAGRDRPAGRAARQPAGRAEPGTRPPRRGAGAAGRVRSVPAARPPDGSPTGCWTGIRELASGKDLGELRQRLRPRLQKMLTGAAGDLLRTGLRSWDVGTLPRVFTATGQA